MINAVSAPGLAARLYFNRYTEDALDPATRFRRSAWEGERLEAPANA